MTIVSDVDVPLSVQDLEDFASYEDTLRTGFETMEKMAHALRDIQKRKLYRAQFRTFEAYVEAKWDMVISRAYQLCSYSKVLDNLYNCGEKPNESHARELAKLTPADQATVWQIVSEAEEKPTAKTVAETAEVLENLRANGVQTFPTHERQCRELLKFPTEMQPIVYEAAVLADDTTAAGIAKAGSAITGVQKEQVVTGGITINVPDVNMAEPSGDSVALSHLKVYWRRTGQRDRKLFLEWVQE